MANNLKNSGPLFFKFVGFQCACASHDLAPLTEKRGNCEQAIPGSGLYTFGSKKAGNIKGAFENTFD